MCDKRRSKLRKIGDKVVHLDSCLEEIILSLNDQGVITLGACCGHFKYQPTIIIKEGKLIKEYYSGITIPRIKRYYVTDLEGYYYIPELLNTEGYKLK
ncbi:MAG: hypothetical protein WC307_06945 [Candidatus Nanoarchaeia archaeon]|jgi:hypothetical protein